MAKQDEFNQETPPGDLNELELAREQTEETSAEEHQFEEGFTFRTFLGLLFVAFVMLPGGIYMGLVAGQGIGAAAEWVTIVLFAEVMRRSFQPLKRQEIYMLYYVAASLTALAAFGLSGGPLQWKIWDQFFVQSTPAAAFAKEIPHWAVPAPDSEALRQRSFLHPDWFIPIALLLVMEVLGRASWMSMGYLMFRATSDVERLPFPMAPVAAAGALALAEAGNRDESWRWGVFSTGTVLGMGFGFFYIAIPVFTGTLFGNAVQLIPIPFWDLTSNTENILPTALTGFSMNLGEILIGFVLPFHILLGAAISSVLTYIVANPILYHTGQITHWQRGSPTLPTQLAVNMDFWLAIGIGVQLAVAVIGISLVIKTLREYRNREDKQSRGAFRAIPAGRGDPPLWLPIVVWLGSVVSYIVICRILVPDFPLWIVGFFGLLWSPLNSYISARMVGLSGQTVGFPYLKEIAIISSRYPHVDIWYAPLPLYDHGGSAQRFREVELTGTKFTSIVKAELVMLPVIFIASFVFWAFFWKASQIPSSLFPFAQRFWPYHAQIDAVWKQLNRPGSEAQQWLLDAMNVPRIAAGFVGGLGCYWLFGVLKLPILFFYGFAGGVGQLPHFTLPKLLGAWLGKRYFAKRFGEDNWIRYAPVLLAGYFCGTGLIGMLAIALALIAKSVSSLPF
ncbi:MAG: peptide transporter [Fimbriimonadia bacterium]|nr:peptide transporter [Fimbriimonadia bacterium]